MNDQEKYDNDRYLWECERKAIISENVELREQVEWLESKLRDANTNYTCASRQLKEQERIRKEDYRDFLLQQTSEKLFMQIGEIVMARDAAIRRAEQAERERDEAAFEALGWQNLVGQLREELDDQKLVTKAAWLNADTSLLQENDRLTQERDALAAKAKELEKDAYTVAHVIVADAVKKMHAQIAAATSPKGVERAIDAWGNTWQGSDYANPLKIQTKAMANAIAAALGVKPPNYNPDQRQEGAKQ